MLGFTSLLRRPTALDERTFEGPSGMPTIFSDLRRVDIHHEDDPSHSQLDRFLGNGDAVLGHSGTVSPALEASARAFPSRSINPPPGGNRFPQVGARVDVPFMHHPAALTSPVLLSLGFSH